MLKAAHLAHLLVGDVASTDINRNDLLGQRIDSRTPQTGDIITFNFKKRFGLSYVFDPCAVSF